MYEISYSQSARKSLKRLMRSGSFPHALFEKLLTLFISGASFPANYKDHALQGNLSDQRECHLGFNLLVIYKRNEERTMLTIASVGTHQELFGE